MLTRCRYLILLSRQGKVVRLVAHPPMDRIAVCLSRRLTTVSSAASGQVVYYSLAQGKGQDYQGCDSAGAFAPDADVQLSRVQRCASTPSVLRCISRGRISHADPSCLSCLIDSKVVYRRYASLFFIAGCESTDNELISLEIVHRYVEQMDKYYGNVCELDIIFNFQKAYFILDELLLAGEMQESSKKNVLRCISQQDSLEDMEVSCPFSYFRLSIPWPVMVSYRAALAFPSQSWPWSPILILPCVS